MTDAPAPGIDPLEAEFSRQFEARTGGPSAEMSATPSEAQPVVAAPQTDQAWSDQALAESGYGTTVGGAKPGEETVLDGARAFAGGVARQFTFGASDAIAGSAKPADVGQDHKLTAAAETAGGVVGGIGMAVAAGGLLKVVGSGLEMALGGGKVAAEVLELDAAAAAKALPKPSELVVAPKANIVEAAGGARPVAPAAAADGQLVVQDAAALPKTVGTAISTSTAADLAPITVNAGQAAVAASVLALGIGHEVLQHTDASPVASAAAATTTAVNPNPPHVAPDTSSPTATPPATPAAAAHPAAAPAVTPHAARQHHPQPAGGSSHGLSISAAERAEVSAFIQQQKATIAAESAKIDGIKHNIDDAVAHSKHHAAHAPEAAGHGGRVMTSDGTPIKGVSILQPDDPVRGSGRGNIRGIANDTATANASNGAAHAAGRPTSLSYKDNPPNLGPVAHKPIAALPVPGFGGA